MNKVVFRNCDEHSLHWIALERLFQTEWSDFLFADTYKSEAHLPPVIVALRNNEVIGGLALKSLKVTLKLFGLMRSLYLPNYVGKVLRVS